MLLYSHDATTRERMRTAVGHKPSPALGKVDFVDAETIDQVIAAADAGAADLLLLDGEAWPTGGAGISRQLKNELASCPPVCLFIARQADRWLAAWSQADAVIVHPADPILTARTVAEVLSKRHDASTGRVSTVRA